MTERKIEIEKLNESKKKECDELSKSIEQNVSRQICLEKKGASNFTSDEFREKCMIGRQMTDSLNKRSALKREMALFIKEEKSLEKKLNSLEKEYYNCCIEKKKFCKF